MTDRDSRVRAVVVDHVARQMQQMPGRRYTGAYRGTQEDYQERTHETR